MEKFACVTGAGKSIGAELARQLLEQGYTVFAGRRIQVSEGLDKLKPLYPEKLHIVDMDIANDASVKAAADYIASRTDSLDILINNGAILGNVTATVFDDLDFEQVQRVFNVNAVGALRVTHALIRLVMNSRTKLIVNISSDAGSISLCTHQAWFGYNMSKTALNMESAILHNSIKNQGGRVIVIHPGWVQTYMRGHLDADAPLTPEESAQNMMKIILNYQKYSTQSVAFVDHLGHVMPW